MLIISKVFTFLCLLCLCGNWEYPGSIQNKAVSSKVFFHFTWHSFERRPYCLLLCIESYQGIPNSHTGGVDRGR